MKTPIGFELLSYNNTRDDLLKYREQGALRGKYLGFPMLDEHYSMALGSCTDWTGSPSSGKTEFLLECLLNTAKFHQWKHLLYVPDIGNKNQIISKLLHKITGKTFDKRYINSNYITEVEIENNLHWVLEHFRIIIKKDLKTKITPYQLWDYATELKNEMHGELHTVTIDSWKDMKRYVDRDGNGIARDDLYLEDVLGYRNDLLDHYDLHMHTIIHPLKTEKDKNGKRMAPGPYDLKGGTTWYDAGKTIITTHRQDGTPNGVDISIMKAKPESVAKMGVVPMCFDKSKLLYYWKNHLNESVYADPVYKKPIALQINNNGEEEDDSLPF